MEDHPPYACRLEQARPQDDPVWRRVLLARHDCAGGCKRALGACFLEPSVPAVLTSKQHADGEEAVARAANALGVGFCMSSAATRSIERVAEQNGDGQRWYQLYWCVPSLRIPTSRLTFLAGLAPTTSSSPSSLAPKPTDSPRWSSLSTRLSSDIVRTTWTIPLSLSCMGSAARSASAIPSSASDGE